MATMKLTQFDTAGFMPAGNFDADRALNWSFEVRRAVAYLVHKGKVPAGEAAELLIDATEKDLAAMLAALCAGVPSADAVSYPETDNPEGLKAWTRAVKDGREAAHRALWGLPILSHLRRVFIAEGDAPEMAPLDAALVARLKELGAEREAQATEKGARKAMKDPEVHPYWKWRTHHEELRGMVAPGGDGEWPPSRIEWVSVSHLREDGGPGWWLDTDEAGKPLVPHLTTLQPELLRLWEAAQDERPVEPDVPAFPVPGPDDGKSPLTLFCGLLARAPFALDERYWKAPIRLGVLALELWEHGGVRAEWEGLRDRIRAIERSNPFAMRADIAETMQRFGSIEPRGNILLADKGPQGRVEIAGLNEERAKDLGVEEELMRRAVEVLRKSRVAVPVFNWVLDEAAKQWENAILQGSLGPDALSLPPMAFSGITTLAEQIHGVNPKKDLEDLRDFLKVLHAIDFHSISGRRDRHLPMLTYLESGRVIELGFNRPLWPIWNAQIEGAPARLVPRPPVEQRPVFKVRGRGVAPKLNRLGFAMPVDIDDARMEYTERGLPFELFEQKTVPSALDREDLDPTKYRKVVLDTVLEPSQSELFPMLIRDGDRVRYAKDECHKIALHRAEASRKGRKGGQKSTGGGRGKT